jgi:glycosyltransferase involved in cell wall biosynthesis
MKILVDLRGLQIKSPSGVGAYTSNLLSSMVPMDQTNSYLFFYNALRPKEGGFRYINSEEKQTRIPNKLLNTSLAFFSFPKFEKLVGKFDCLFLPNLHHFAVESNKKVVITVHDLSPIVTPEYYDTKRRIWHYMLSFKKKLQRANAIIAVSEFTAFELKRVLGIDSNKITVVSEGVNHDLYSPHIEEEKLRELRNRLNLPGEFILFLSTIEPRKNLPTLIEAVNKLPENVHLVVAGSLGWKYEEVLAAYRKSSRKQNIHFLGYVSENDKPALIKLAKVVAYPSFYEGFGLVPLEAMAIGTPTVVSNVTSLPEVVGNAGLLVDARNSNWLKAALQEALYNESVRDNLVKKGFEQASKFTWEEASKKTLEVFNSI